MIFRYLTSFFTLMGFLFLGNLIAGLGRLPVPGSVIGMVLLTAALHYRWLPLRMVEPTAGLLVRHLAFLFVPPGVGLMLYFGLLRDDGHAIAAGGIVSTVAVLLVVGYVQQRLGRHD